MLTIVYRAEKEEGSGIVITQGDQFSSTCAAELGPTCSITSAFTYDVLFRMRGEVSAFGLDARFSLPSHAELQIQSVIDQTGHAVTLNIVPEPGTLLVTALGLVWA